MRLIKNSLLAIMLFCTIIAHAQQPTQAREHLLMDAGWRFALGHAYDTKKDFNNGTSVFSYMAKAGYGDGAAAEDFDDRAWRKLDLPHDWAVEQGFSPKGTNSHGYKAIGRNFPEASVGWYRKTFAILASDLGRRVHIAFDGVFRNSIVWVNGHYLGTEISGYSSFEYDITDYLNYGGDNVVAVRADVTLEEGWFYEGAGIYRHVWLNKTNPVHIPANGTFVTAQVNGREAAITANVTVRNDNKTAKIFNIQQTIVDAAGKALATASLQQLSLKPFEEKDFSTTSQLQNPMLWDIENPYLHKLVTNIKDGDKVLDTYTTTFGIRTIKFDADHGFFLNGKHVKIKGTNNHQDHAGVGAAMPDALQYYRIASLKAIGSNALRCSHNPPTPALLEACDKLGMVVIVENRLMGITQYHFGELKNMILRDRNHPSVISWSIGNEEWGIENSPMGARVASTMQAYVKTIDSTRPATAAFSGGIGSQGITTVMDLLGINYIANKNTDKQHQLFPQQALWGTEEGATVATRGEYMDDNKQHYRAAYDTAQNKDSYSIERGWKHYAQRDYLAGMFIWTGFDYRGEPSPFDWPSNVSLFGMLDYCGFPKDDAYYLKAWWGDKPALHILPHWNWAGKEGQEIAVWAYSNCDEVELFLNKKSLGKKAMPLNSHLEWKVKYQQGTLLAIGYKGGKKILEDKVQTTGDAVSIQLAADKTAINADKEDIAVLTVDALDKNNLHVPTAGNNITFSIEGPGKIIGVGNSDPTSLEVEKYVETVQVAPIENLKEKIVDGLVNRPETAVGYDDNKWGNAFKDIRDEAFAKTNTALVYRGIFTMPDSMADATVTLLYKCIGTEQSIYINGKLLAANIKQENGSNQFAVGKKLFAIDKSKLHPGKNVIAIVGSPLIRKNQWHTPNMDAGVFQIIYPAAQYKRNLFNGLAQVIVQSTGEAGVIVLTANANGLKQASIKITAQPSVKRPAIAE
ncbi:beta-galactosidase GalA [Parasediminibacterium sp. JCM 36343]|uniref:beta-galactosidase GalA n=1 Tax=Parasediminibacterium sp. JCM 36343 TaxID=3374279 RepID=UPI00397CC65C